MPVLTQDELGRVQRLLDHLGYDLEPSILIGGWATQMRVGGDVSRDIDLIIMDQGLRQKRLLTVHAHTATKFAAILDRAHSEKGEKDAREINRLLAEGASPQETIAVVVDATAGDLDLIPAYVEEVFELVPRLAEVNKKRRRELASLRRVWVDEADYQLRDFGAAP